MNAAASLSELPYDAFQQERFFLAVRDGRIADAVDALSKGAQVNKAEDSGGIRGIHLAALKDNAPMLEALLEHGADPNLPNLAGHTALSIAFRTNKFHLGFLLLKHGANPNVSAHGEVPLCMVLSRNPFYKNRELVHEFLAYDADPNLADERGNTALHYAANGPVAHADLVFRMLYAGGDAWQPNEYGQNLFQIGANSNDQAIRGAIARYEKMPHFREADLATLTKDKLFEKDKHNACLLDDPQTWHHFDEVAAALEKNGEHLTLEDLQQTVDLAIPAIAMAARCHSLAPVLKHLAKHGERLSLGDILKPHADGRSGMPLSRFMEANRQCAALFDIEIWRGGSRHELSTLYHGLPEPLREQVPNYHSLAAEVSRQEIRQYYAPGRG